eukprot:354196-Chlamydomonas_euryale.AAC.1
MQISACSYWHIWPPSGLTVKSAGRHACASSVSGISFASCWAFEESSLELPTDASSAAPSRRPAPAHATRPIACAVATAAVGKDACQPQVLHAASSTTGRVLCSTCPGHTHSRHLA